MNKILVRKKILAAVLLSCLCLFAKAQAPSSQLKTLKLDVVDIYNQSVLKASTDRSVKVYTTIADTDSTIQAATTRWVKRQLYAEKDAPFTPQSVPYALANRKLGEDPTGLRYDGNSLWVGRSGFSNVVGLYLNENRAYLTASGFGANFGTTGGQPTDPSKSINFWNSSVQYLKMWQPGLDGLGANDTLETLHYTNHFPVTTNKYQFGKASARWSHLFARNIYCDTFQLKDGTQGVNKVLTSDANGNGSWKAQVKDTSFITNASQSVLEVTTSGGKDSLGFKKQGPLKFIAAGADSNIVARVIVAADISSIFVDNEEIPRSNSSTYTLAFIPAAGSLNVWKNGVKLPSSEYLVTGAIVTLTSPRDYGDIISNNYRK